MTAPILSVLVPMVPGRSTATLESLLEQARGRPVEVLALLDNRMRSIGLKRDALLHSSRGEYVAFVDDDDLISSQYINMILIGLLPRPDAVLFDVEVRDVSGEERQDLLICKLGSQDEDIRFDGTPVKRGLWHIHTIRGELARKAHFPDLQYGEDIVWLRQVRPLVRETTKVDSVLYTYLWRGE